ncbi:MAG: AI-2E family transporter [Prolixibacteraceae bacterium]
MKFPPVVKISLFLLGLVAFLFIIYIAQGIILPLIFAALVAIILHPVVNLIMRLRIHRIIAITITLLLSSILVAAFGTFFYSQFNSLSESLPLFIDRGTEIFNETNAWAINHFDLKPEKIHEWIAEYKGEFLNKNGDEIGKTLVSLGSLLGALFITPVYVFLFLYYHPLLLEFFHRLFGKGNRSEVTVIITEVKTLIQSYLVGLSIEVAIIAILYTVGLLILGIKYALILAILGALLNVIPYLGAILAAIMPMFIAFATKTQPLYFLLVLAMYIIIQFIDNNFLVPKIVASKVKINVLVSIFAVIAFGALWGIPGMFLSIPLTAIVKLIFDHIETLKPWGFLLGDTMPSKIKPFQKK